MKQLARYDAMVTAIASCHAVDEVKMIHDKARAMEVYAKQAMNLEAERKATQVRLRAERRAGELLRDMKREPTRGLKAGNKSPSRHHGVTGKSDYSRAIDDNGINPRTAQRWQELASVPATTFESALEDPDRKPTTRGLIAKAPAVPKMDDDALWIWGRLRDFERMSLGQRRAADLFRAMTDTMQADCRRIAPSVRDWLTNLEEACA